MKQRKLENKIVINSDSGEILGYINDFEVDISRFNILAVFVEERGSLLTRLFPWFFKSKSYQIQVDDILSIGSDVILVHMKK